MAKKVPETRFPMAVAASYYREIRGLIYEMWKVCSKIFDESIREQIKAYKNRYDAASLVEDGPLDVIRQAIEQMKAISIQIFSADNVQRIASNFVSGVERFNGENMKQQGRVIGVNPLEFEPQLDEFMRTAVAENVSYISRFKDDFFPQLESIIYQGTKTGISEAEMKRQLMAKVGMSEKKAKFIARDQTGSILGQLTAERHKNMGVTKFKWVTSKDEAVRPTHKANEGRVFEYKNPPPEGLPGEDYRCRCTATPIFE